MTKSKSKAKPTPSATQTDLWALLVGVNAYKNTREFSYLHGCLNDVAAMREFLMSQMDVPEARIQLLADAAATRAAILAGFQSLINNAAISKQTQVLIMYSGHGSRMPNRDKSEPDGFDETICPYDARTTDHNKKYIFDIPDKTIAALIARLSQRTDNITVIFDCCHSGSGTRGLDDVRTGVRRAPDELHLPPIDLDEPIQRGFRMRGTGGSGWTQLKPNHVLMAGCLDKELSREHDGDGVTQGAMSYFLLQYLRGAPSNATYGDMHAYVKARVSSIYQNQTPQCEGNRNRIIFDGAEIAPDPFVGIKAVSGETVTLDAGQLSGLGEGAELAVYPPKTVSRKALEQPLATLTVTQASASQATARVSQKTKSFGVDARCLLTRVSYGANKVRVALTAAKDPQAKKQLAALRVALKGMRLIELVDDAQRPQLRVEARAGQLCIVDAADGRLLVLPEETASLPAMQDVLQKIARFQVIRDMENSTVTPLKDKVTMQMRRCKTLDANMRCTEAEKAIAASSAPKAKVADRDGKAVLAYDPQDELTSAYVVDVVNNSTLPVYAYLYVMNQDFSIARLYPTDNDPTESIVPGQTVSVGMSDQRGAVLSILPPESPNQTWVRNDDVLKLIVTAQPQDDLRQFIEQESLKVPPPKHATREKLNVLADLMNAAEGNTRGKPLKAEATDVWVTVNLPYTAVRKPQEVAFGKKAQTLWVNEIQIEKPNGLVGNIDVGVADAAVTRGGAVSVPPFLQAAQYGYKPMRLPSNTRGTAEDVLVISIEAEGNTNRAVTAKNPLTLTLPENLVQGADDVLPIAFDGEDFLVVGSANPANLREVTLWQMPDAVATAPAGGPTVRGVSRVVRLYLMTKIGRHIEDIGLRFGKMENGAAVYSAVPDKFFKKGQKQTVALLVHGFISDTEWMVRDIPQIAGQKYAHVLTFDYETFGTGISDNGQELAMALQRSGLSATDDVTLHVYAHSMGCLVTRSLVELHGGNAFVDKAVLAGPPNKGTTLANLSRGLVFLITEALNIAGNSLWASGGNWLLSKLADDAQGWADLKTNSDLVKTLRAQPDPAQTQYLVLAGDNTAIPANASQVARLAQKLIGKTMDEVFGEKDNDAVIGMSSLSQVRGVGSNAVLQVAPCDHFRYYADPTNREKIISWI